MTSRFVVSQMRERPQPSGWAKGVLGVASSLLIAFDFHLTHARRRLLINVALVYVFSSAQHSTAVYAETARELTPNDIQDVRMTSKKRTRLAKCYCYPCVVSSSSVLISNYNTFERPDERWYYINYSQHPSNKIFVQCVSYHKFQK